MTYEPEAPNLRQVHLMHEELFDELALKGYDVSAGGLGENVTTRGVDLLGLPTGALLHLGDEAVVEVTGLRNPVRRSTTTARDCSARCSRWTPSPVRSPSSAA